MGLSWLKRRTLELHCTRQQCPDCSPVTQLYIHPVILISKSTWHLLVLPFSTSPVFFQQGWIGSWDAISSWQMVSNSDGGRRIYESISRWTVLRRFLSLCCLFVSFCLIIHSITATYYSLALSLSLSFIASSPLLFQHSPVPMVQHSDTVHMEQEHNCSKYGVIYILHIFNILYNYYTYVVRLFVLNT